MKLTLKTTCAALMALSVQTAFAGNFSITPLEDVKLPTGLVSGQTVVAYFVVTNETDVQLNGYQVQGLPDSVIQETRVPNYYNNLKVCGNPINLQAQKSCLLQLVISAPVSSSFAVCKAESCTRSAVPLNVSSKEASTKPSFAYVTQYIGNESVKVCTVNDGVAVPADLGKLENCTNAGGGDVLLESYPQGIQINNTGSTAFLTTYNEVPYVYQCPIYANTGKFGACSLSEITSPTGYDPYYGFLALNKDNSVAFLTDNNDYYSTSYGRILACPIESNIIQSECTDTGIPAGNAIYPIGIALNSANTRAYIGNDDVFVTTCAVSGTTYSACGNKTGDTTTTKLFEVTAGTAVNTAGTYVYIADYKAGIVYACDTTTSTTATIFSSCKPAKSITYAWGITLNADSSVAYVTNDDSAGEVSACKILADGTFGTCNVTSSFYYPADVALLY